MVKGKSSHIMSVLIVTNDSTVFLKKGLASAFEMFGGRAEEVKRLVARLDTSEKDGSKLCEVSFGVISSRFGFVPGNYVITNYDKVMSSKEDYEQVQEEKDYLGQLDQISRYFDKVVVCVPKEMFRMMLDSGTFQQGKVIAVTSMDFKEECERRGWTHLERKGARVGNDNAEHIYRMIFDLQ